MKIKNREILNFAELRLGDKHLPVKVAFAIASNAEAVNGVLKAYREQREALVNKYATKAKDGELEVKEDGTLEIKDIAGWSKDIEELLEAEAEVSVTKIKVEDLAKCDDEGFDSLSLAEISVMRFMVE